jgi:hypothetical protein
MNVNKVKICKDIEENYHKYSAKYFSQKYGLNLSTVYKYAGNLRVTGHNILEKQSLNIISDFKKGYSISELYNKYGHTKKTLEDFLIKHGFKIKDMSESRIIYNFNINYFEKIDSHEKAYWLGFLYADGNVHKNMMQIGLSKKDVKILKIFRKHLSSNHPFYLDNSKGYNKNGKNVIKFCIRSMKFVKDLINLGCIPKKSLVLTFPTVQQVPEEFINSFILGYFDGDGSISTKNKKHKQKFSWKLQMVSTKHFLEGVRARISNITKTNGCIIEDKKTKNLCYLSYGGSYKTDNGKIVPRLIYDFFYHNINFALKRKELKFRSIIS